MINPIYEDNHIIVVEKPINVLVQADKTNDLDLLTIIKNYLKTKYNKPGDAYLGLVHRLDRPVGGIMVFAKTSKAASRLSEQIRNNELDKIYYAIVCGKLEKNKGILEDKLKKDIKTNIVSISEDGKISKLEYEVVDYKEGYSLIKIHLITGRSHQIRVQFASRNHPLFGDAKYNKNHKNKEQIALFAKEISFYHPIKKEKLTFSIDLPTHYPWNIFK
ncbi:MAG: RluA family pseudouridine synthase [Bacilli bacterium]|nr:RluA family pseudouridine synthase [Bacilli bacterium]